MWGLLPVGLSLFALFIVFRLPDREVAGETIEFPAMPLPDLVHQEARR
jgi:hypothetical protein